MILISEKTLLKYFGEYTEAIYRDCGRNFNQKSKGLLKARVNKFYKENTLWAKIKGVFKRKK